MLNIIKSLPGYYRTSKVMENLTGAEDTELDQFLTKVDEALNQVFVDTATYKLEDWEKDLGIKTDTTKTDSDRRSVIKSRLRGSGTITISHIKNVAESYVNGQVDVIEDNPNFRFTVKFVDPLGIPPNLADLQKVINDLKPAHLGVTYEFTYNTNADLSIFTHAHLATYTHTQLREEEII